MFCSTTSICIMYNDALSFDRLLEERYDNL